MVKIVNVFGDIKTGKQGAAVYQRKDGEQIRRLAAPKRAIPSQVQIAHRELYKAALIWRKGLSLPNRRYLDGYCIANWIVDKYKIPLHWSRFALKLYLQAIKFVVITKPVAGEEGEEEMYENYDDCTGAIGYRYTTWGAQSFTPLAAHNITKARLKLYVTDHSFDDEVTVSIKATDGSGHPTGDDMVSKTLSSLELPTAGGDWIDFIFPTNPPLSAGIVYAIVLRGPGFPISKYVNSRRRSTDPAYPRGCMLHSTNSGGTWEPLTQEWCFEEYGAGTGIEPVPGLIHVRQPSLLTVVQKRGEVIITEYDTLSSLDDEYFTGQVGLDVEAGDLIIATTLPGIEKSFVVS